MKRFCVLTTGRAGSTSLMNCLSAHQDIVTPDKHIKNPDNELLHPDWVKRYVNYYQAYIDRPITNELQLFQAFFASAEQENYIGFKSMPNRHRHLHTLVNHPDIQIITLCRRDIPSTIASFMLAIDKGTWRRNGEKQAYRLRYSEQQHDRILGHLQYILGCQKMMQGITGAIHLEYEALCDPGFSDDALNQYFQRSIKLDSPKLPIDGESYVENWGAFTQFVEQKISDNKQP